MTTVTRKNADIEIDGFIHRELQPVLRKFNLAFYHFNKTSAYKLSVGKPDEDNNACISMELPGGESEQIASFHRNPENEPEIFLVLWDLRENDEIKLSGDMSFEKALQTIKDHAEKLMIKYPQVARVTNALLPS